jgi:antitoxin MazE
MSSEIKQWGNSGAVRLPKSDMEKAGLAINDSVVIVAEKGKITLIKSKAPKSHKTLEERLQNYQGGYTGEKLDWGNPVGKEAW